MKKEVDDEAQIEAAIRAQDVSQYRNISKTHAQGLWRYVITVALRGKSRVAYAKTLQEALQKREKLRSEIWPNYISDIKRVKINTLPGFSDINDNYWVTEAGDILSMGSGMEPLKPTKHGRINLMRKKPHYKSLRMILIKDIVASAFVPKPKEGHYKAAFKSKNHSDFSAANLMWVQAAKRNSSKVIVHREADANQKIYRYDENGLVKVYDRLEDVVEDGFTEKSVKRTCRHWLSTSGYPTIRYKGNVFSYEPLDMADVRNRIALSPSQAERWLLSKKKQKSKNISI